MPLQRGLGDKLIAHVLTSSLKTTIVSPSHPSYQFTLPLILYLSCNIHPPTEAHEFISISLSLSPSGQGGNGYDEMHRYIKQGEEFCKEMENIVTERLVLSPCRSVFPSNRANIEVIFPLCGKLCVR